VRIAAALVVGRHESLRLEAAGAERGLELFWRDRQTADVGLTEFEEHALVVSLDQVVAIDAERVDKLLPALFTDAKGVGVRRSDNVGDHWRGHGTGVPAQLFVPGHAVRATERSAKTPSRIARSLSGRSRWFRLHRFA
jgi:hypothetical protein